MPSHSTMLDSSPREVQEARRKAQARAREGAEIGFFVFLSLGAYMAGLSVEALGISVILSAIFAFGIWKMAESSFQNNYGNHPNSPWRFFKDE
jgi:hypothetical protein